MKSKKEEDLVCSFISSSTVKIESVATSISFVGTPQKSALESLVIVDGQTSVNHVSRGQGFIEIAQGKAAAKIVNSIIIRNSIKAVIYQASLSFASEFKECKDRELIEDDMELIEIEIDVFRKQGEKVVKDTLRAAVNKFDKMQLVEALAKSKGKIAN